MIITFPSIIKRYSLYLLPIALIFSCNDIDHFDPFPAIIKNYGEQSKSILKELNTESLEFNIDASTGGKCNFKDNVQVIFKPNSFHYNGNPVGSKIIKIVIKKILSKSEMAANGIQTISGQHIISSLGMLHIQAFYGEKELQLASGVIYEIRIPTNINTLPPNVELFYGETREKFNWVEADNGDPTASPNVFKGEWKSEFNGEIINGIKCYPERLNWINCDYFTKYENLNKISPCITPIIDPNNDIVEIIGMCVLKNQNSILDIPFNGLNSLCLKNIPMGTEVSFILIGKGKKDYYFGESTQIIKSDESINILCKIQSLEEIRKSIEKL